MCIRDSGDTAACAIATVSQAETSAPNNDIEESAFTMVNDESPGMPVNWIIDTGCSNDIISEKIASRFKRMASGRIHKMKTANGIIATESQAVVPIPELSHDANPRIYKNTPALLAIGERCMNHNYGFYWEPGQKPYIKLPNGSKVTLEVVNGVPILASRGSASLSIDHDVDAAIRSMNLSSVALTCEEADVEAAQAPSRRKDNRTLERNELISIVSDSSDEESSQSLPLFDPSPSSSSSDVSSTDYGDSDVSSDESDESPTSISASSCVSDISDTE